MSCEVVDQPARPESGSIAESSISLPCALCCGRRSVYAACSTAAGSTCEHLRQPDGRAADLAALRVMRFDERLQSRPRHDRLHVGEELLASRLTLLACELGAGKAGLLHGRILVVPGAIDHRVLPGLISASLAWMESRLCGAIVRASGRGTWSACSRPVRSANPLVRSQTP